MSLPTLRDSWLYSREARRVGLLNKKLSIPAFSANCGEASSSLLFNAQSPGTVSFEPAIADLRNAITLEAWVKVPFNSGLEQFPVFSRTIDGVINSKSQWEFGIAGGGIYLKFTKGAVINLYTTVEASLNMNKWNHIAWSWDGVVARPYINGVALTTGALAAPVDAVVTPTHSIGYELFGGSTFVGNINEVRVWKVARTFDQILGAMNSPRNIIALDGIDDDLVIYCKCRSLLAPTGTKEYLNNQIVGVPVGTVEDTEDAYPMRYGASFIAAQIPITLSEPNSIRFPVRRPQNTDHALIVSWIPSVGVVERRLLYGGVGESINPYPAKYNGEELPVNFKLEFWNIDGNSTINVEESYNIELSKTTQPQHAGDQDQEEAAIVAVDTTLAEPFFWTPFPLQFNEQQTYPS